MMIFFWEWKGVGWGGDMSVYMTLVAELQLVSLYGRLDAIVSYMPKTTIYGDNYFVPQSPIPTF